MVDSVTNTQASSNATSQLNSFVSSKKNEALGKNEFLQLLVTQLKNQDPLDPMKSDEFAVNLAQFSQLEQLVGINEKVGKTSTSDFSSMASYLGTEVTINSSTTTVENGEAGSIRINLPRDVSKLDIELVDAAGNVKGTLQTGAVSAGKHTVELGATNTAPGSYSVRVKGLGVNGGTFDVPANAAGLVTGFVPGADPKLIIGTREISPADIKEVNVPAAAAQK